MRRGSREWKDEESYIQMDTPMLICMRDKILEPKKNTRNSLFVYTQRESNDW